ncbi:MAG: SDR family oxidoreductase [Phyllobacteriaceae bacterium]|nr:SDR family oxidoreductase [Phyllobacteriaceae bacterium]
MPGRLSGQHVIVTQAESFMGPALVKLFTSEGAQVLAGTDRPHTPAAAQELVDHFERVDVLVANLMHPNSRNATTGTPDEEWLEYFSAMVDPLHWLVGAVLPQMLLRGSGKIVVMGSANGLRGSAPRAAYSAARGAQIAYVKAVGHEVAGQGVNVNIIAQNYVSNPTSYPAAVVDDPAFGERLRDVPVGRVAQDWESAALALYLATDEARFFHGQTFPLSGGWTT